MGAVFTDGSLDGSLGRSLIWPVVQLHVSRCEQKGREDFAEPGGFWQDQDCLSVTPAAGWGDVSADPHPERPGSCFFLKVVSKEAAALLLCTDTLFCFKVLVRRAVCIAQQQGAACGSSLVAEILQRLYEQGARVCSRKGRMWSNRTFSSPFYIARKHQKIPSPYLCVSSHWENWSLK